MKLRTIEFTDVGLQDVMNVRQVLSDAVQRNEMLARARHTTDSERVMFEAMTASCQRFIQAMEASLDG